MKKFLFVNIEKLKQMVVIRTDLKMGKGKMVAQGCHASVGAAFKVYKRERVWFNKWEVAGSKKIVCKVKSEEELVEIYEKARALKFPTVLIQDQGRTQVPFGTKTAVGIGPIPSSKVEQIVNHLKLL